VIYWIYIKGSSNILHNHIALWIHEAAHQHWQWDLLVCPVTLMLYQGSSCARPATLLQLYATKYAMYDTQPTHNQVKPPAQPTLATPYILEDWTTIFFFSQSKHIANCHHLYHLLQPWYNIPMTPQKKWEAKLWHHITPHAPLPTLNNTPARGSNVFLCSNVALDAAKYLLMDNIHQATTEEWQRYCPWTP